MTLDSPRLRNFLAAWAATALSGGLYALAFPPLQIRPAAWIALVPFFWALRRVRLRGALFLAWFWAVFASSFVADALPKSVETYFLQPPLQSVLFAVGVWTLTGSIYYMLFAPAYRAAARLATPAATLLAGAAWAAGEFARGALWTGSQGFVGNPWALVAYSQMGWLPLMQAAAITGVYGVSFAIASVNAGLAVLVERAAAGTLRAGYAVRVMAVAAAPAIACLVFGAWALSRAPDPQDRTGAVPVALVQGNIDLGSRWRSEFYGQNLDVYMRQSLEAMRAHQPEVVFWPEGALTFFLEEEPLYRRALGRLLTAGDAQLVVGGPRSDGDGRAPFYNTVFLLEPSGEIAARYDKEHLVPFSEYFPFARFDFLRRRFERIRVFSHGAANPPPVQTAAGRVGMLVCNEAMYPEVARARVRAGAELLASPSNDSWIQDEKWAQRMFDLTALRAIEQRRYFVRASTSGPSAIVDPWGRTQVRTESFTRDMAGGFVVPRSEPSLYGRLGDAFAWGCAVAAAVGWLLGQRRRSQTSPNAASTRSSA